ncbi:MAG: hypothetical protein WKG03_17205 [Telluria sp.]
MMIRLFSQCAVGAALLAASAIAIAAPMKAQALSITASIQEFVGPSPRCASNFGSTLTGQGISPLLGRVVLIGTDCITPSGPLLNFSDGKIVIVTTSGEQIYANYTGQAVPTGEGTKYLFNGATFHITGGTGSNFRATGGGTITGGGDLATGAGAIEIAGQITRMGR